MEEIEDDDDNCRGSDIDTCDRHHLNPLDSRGKCTICELLKSHKNSRFKRKF